MPKTSEKTEKTASPKAKAPGAPKAAAAEPAAAKPAAAKTAEPKAPKAKAEPAAAAPKRRAGKTGAAPVALSAPAGVSADPTLDTEAVAKEAYLLWMAEGQPHGKDQEHWSRAEEIVRRRGRVADAAD